MMVAAETQFSIRRARKDRVTLEKNNITYIEMIIVLDNNICTNKNTPLKYTASLESYVHAYVCVFMCEHESLCVHMHVCVGRRLWSNIVLNHKDEGDIIHACSRCRWSFSAEETFLL